MSEKIEKEVREFMSVLGMITSILSIASSVLVLTANPIAFISTVITFFIMDLLIWLNWVYRIIPALISFELITCARIIIAIVFYTGVLLLVFSFLTTYPIYIMTFIALGISNIVLGIVLLKSYISKIRELKSRFWIIK